MCGGAELTLPPEAAKHWTTSGSAGRDSRQRGTNGASRRPQAKVLGAAGQGARGEGLSGGPSPGRALIGMCVEEAARGYVEPLRGARRDALGGHRGLGVSCQPRSRGGQAPGRKITASAERQPPSACRGNAWKGPSVSRSPTSARTKREGEALDKDGAPRLESSPTHRASRGGTCDSQWGRKSVTEADALLTLMPEPVEQALKRFL